VKWAKGSTTAAPSRTKSSQPKEAKTEKTDCAEDSGDSTTGESQPLAKSNGELTSEEGDGDGDVEEPDEEEEEDEEVDADALLLEGDCNPFCWRHFPFWLILL
jgi:hypothetical protein